MTRGSLVLLFLGSIAAAQDRPVSPVDCDDNFAECKEDCSIKWGGTTSLKARAKLTPCVNKCRGIELDCRESFFETKRNSLDEGAIAGSPSSRDVDSDGIPTKTAATKKEPAKPKKEDEELRDDRRREEPAPVVEKAEARTAEPAARPELTEAETPKSSRSQLKADPKAAKTADKPTPGATPAAKPTEQSKPEPKRDDPPPRREEPKKVESEVREEEAAPAPPPKKREEKREEPKEKKKRALDEWDPDAL